MLDAHLRLAGWVLAMIAWLPMAATAQPPTMASIERAAAYSENLGGTALLILHDGETIYERYANGGGPDVADTLQSGTKGFWGPVVAAMIDDGLITSFDEPAVDTLDEWQADPLKRMITIRHLLQLNALHTQDLEKLQGCPPDCGPGCERLTLADDLYTHAINTPARRQPGVQFTYGPVNYYALGEILRRKLQPLGQTPLEYLEQRLFLPLGISYTGWCHDNSGNPHLPNGAYLTARDWAAFGQFLLDEGATAGGQLVSADLMRELREPSGPNPGHGLALWLNTPGGASYVGEQINVGSDPDWPGGFIYNNGEPDLFGAMGGGKNRMYMLPSRDLVVVRRVASGWNDTYVDHDFLEILLEEPDPANYDFSQVTEFLDANLAAFDGRVVVLLERDGTRLYEYTAGGFTPDTQQGIASATKWMAGAIIARLAEDGLYGLDDRVGNYLAAMETAGKGDFTIRQGFSMSGGLYTARLTQRYHSQPDLTLAESVDLIAANVPLVYTPGTAVAYYGGQMQVVGLIAERETGTPWRTLAAETLFGPLGLANTDYDYFPVNPAVAGGIRSTPDDYMRFLRMLQNGGLVGEQRFLSQESVDLLLSNQTEGLPILHSPFEEFSDWFPDGTGGFPYGFGTWVFRRDPETREARELSSPGAFGTYPWIDRDRNVRGIIFTSLPAGTSQNYDETFRVMQLLRNAIDDAEKTAVRLGILTEPYFDPEFSSEEDLMAFQDTDRKIWLTRLNPRDGFFASSTHGKDIFIDGSATQLLLSNNGPEFGRDREGWAVYYSRQGLVSQIARGVLDGDTVTTSILSPMDGNRSNCLPSRIDTADDVLLMYIDGFADVGDTIMWAADTQPFEETPYIFWDRSAGVPVQWLPDREGIAVTRLREGETNQRLGVYDVRTGEETWISDGTDNMTYPAPFNAPEFGGALCIAAVADQEELVVFRELPGGGWEEVSRLRIPEESAYTRISSPEAFAFRGRSFLSLQIENDDNEALQAGEIWVWGIEEGPDRIAVRCDEGGGDPLRRSDPEFYVGENDVFVYYNLINDSLLYEVWRGRTGLGKRVEIPPADPFTGWQIH